VVSVDYTVHLPGAVGAGAGAAVAAAMVVVRVVLVKRHAEQLLAGLLTTVLL
jgi:hypothetical protein